MAPTEAEGLLRIALYHPQQTLSGGGVLLNVRFRMTGGVSAQSSLALQNVLFNNGTPPVVAHAGGVTSSAYQVAGVVRYQGSVRAVSGVTVTVSGAQALCPRGNPCLGAALSLELYWSACLPLPCLPEAPAAARKRCTDAAPFDESP